MAGFDLVSGRKTNYVGKVIEAEFRSPKGYEGTVLNLAVELEDGNTWNESYSLGKNWSVISPQEVVSTTGATKIVMTSLYGRFITRVLSLPNGSEILTKLADEGKGALDADVWVGFTFLFEEETIDFGKTIDPRTINMPVEIVSYQAGAAASSVEEVTETLREIARNAANIQEFMGSAMAVPGVSSNGKLVDGLNGIWKEVRQ